MEALSNGSDDTAFGEGAGRALAFFVGCCADVSETNGIKQITIKIKDFNILFTFFYLIVSLSNSAEIITKT
jgi:hypothetical protein